MLFLFAISISDTTLVFLFFWNYTTNVTLGVLYISLVAGNKMHMAVENGLAHNVVDVDTNIVAIWVESFVYLLLDALLHLSFIDVFSHRIFNMLCSKGKHFQRETVQNNTEIGKRVHLIALMTTFRERKCPFALYRCYYLQSYVFHNEHLTFVRARIIEM